MLNEEKIKIMNKLAMYEQGVFMLIRMKKPVRRHIILPIF